jgi:hypothetical protein
MGVSPGSHAGQQQCGGAVMIYEINEVNDRPVGKAQEKVLMNIATSFPSIKNQVILIRRRADNTTEGDAC